MSESGVLQLILDGRIYVDTERGRVWKQKSTKSGGYLPYFVLLSQLPDRQRGYLFVDIYANGRRRRTAVHRIVMMATTLALIPEDRDIDHRDRNVRNNAISNLRQQPKAINRATSAADTF